jgi:hypothetical protein
MRIASGTFACPWHGEGFMRSNRREFLVIPKKPTPHLDLISRIVFSRFLPRASAAGEDACAIVVVNQTPGVTCWYAMKRRVP